MSLHSAWLMLSLLSTTVNKESRDLQTVFAAVGSRLHFSAERAGCEPTASGQLDCTGAVRREPYEFKGFAAFRRPDTLGESAAE